MLVPVAYVIQTAALTAREEVFLKAEDLAAPREWASAPAQYVAGSGDGAEQGPRRDGLNEFEYAGVHEASVCIHRLGPALCLQRQFVTQKLRAR